MSYVFDIKMLCGGYVYFSTFTCFGGYSENNRERRTPDQIIEDRILEDLKLLGHSVFGVSDDKGFEVWLRAKGWAVVSKNYAHSSMQQWLKTRECVLSPVGMFTDIEIVSPKTLKRSYRGKGKSAILARDGDRCLECGSTENLTMQHVIPHSFGGETTSRNMVTFCESCNQKYENNVAYEYLESTGLYQGYERSIINDNWYSLEQQRTAAKLTQNLMQSRCEVW